MVNATDYRAQAAKCRADADSATLDNVRERNLRAEAAWLDMAERHERTTASRLARENRAELMTTIQETT